jgi:hypothetical protein
VPLKITDCTLEHAIFKLRLLNICIFEHMHSQFAEIWLII